MRQSSRAIYGCISHQSIAPQSYSSPQSQSSLSRPPTSVFLASLHSYFRSMPPSGSGSGSGSGFNWMWGPWPRHIQA